MRMGLLLTAALVVAVAAAVPLATWPEEDGPDASPPPSTTPGGPGAFEEVIESTARTDQQTPGASVAHVLGAIAEAEGRDLRPPGPCPSLEQAISAHAERLGVTVPRPAAGLPQDLAEAVGCLLDAVHAANLAMDRVFHDVPPQLRLRALSSEEGRFDGLTELTEGRDRGPILQAAVHVAEQVDRALPALQRSADAGDVSVLDLPPIVRVSTGSTTYDQNYALVVDLRGNDVYDNHAGGIFAAAGVTRHAVDPERGGQRIQVLGGGAHAGDNVQDADAVLSSSLVVDLGGDDRYGVKHSPMLLDRRNGCTKEPVVPMVGTIGAGIMGVGMLFDLAGDDAYVGRMQTQGAGHVLGVGVLYSGPGNDTFEAIRAGQGSGLLGGVGLLISEGGDDAYASNPVPGGVWNVDLAFCDKGTRYLQGSSFDRRSGPLLPSWGMLVDKAGDDRYTAGILAQGFGQGPGAGMLVDLAGDDQYSAKDRAQGAAQGRSKAVNPQAPWGGGVGLLLDERGADIYTVGDRGQGWSLGMDRGSTPPLELEELVSWTLDRNEAVGMLRDEGGGDTYVGPPGRGDGEVNVDGVLGLFEDSG